MSWWTCKTCGHESYDSRAAFQHQNDARHDGNTLVTVECPPASGSTPEGRRRARELFEAARREAKA